MEPVTVNQRRTLWWPDDGEEEGECNGQKMAVSFLFLKGFLHKEFLNTTRAITRQNALT